ncbi:hypothetical protein ACFYO1_31655 [Nocardia sp. NPDC006044]
MSEDPDDHSTPSQSAKDSIAFWEHAFDRRRTLLQDEKEHWETNEQN